MPSACSMATNTLAWSGVAATRTTAERGRSMKLSSEGEAARSVAPTGDFVDALRAVSVTPDHRRVKPTGSPHHPLPPRTMQLLAASLFAALLPAQLVSAQASAVILYAGLDGGADVPFHAAMVPPTGLTVEAWVRFDDATMPTGVPYFPTIVGQNVDTAPSWLLRVASGSTNNRIVEFLVRDGAGVSQVLSWPFAAGELGNWTHLAATYDGQVMTL